MNKRKVANELIKLAKVLISADTFKCPECDTKVLKQTGYCVKCKKKVKEASAKILGGGLSDENIKEAQKLLKDFQDKLKSYVKDMDKPIRDGKETQGNWGLWHSLAQTLEKEARALKQKMEKL